MPAPPLRFVLATVLVACPLSLPAQQVTTSAAEPSPAAPSAVPSDAPPAGDEAAAGAPAAEAPKPPLPMLVVGDPIRDLGRLQRGEQADVEFTLENRGGAPLKIKSAQPSCGCTVISFDSVVAPGKTGVVHARLDTSTLEGAVAKTITVLTNDAQTPRAVLTIKADIGTYVHVAPAFARIVRTRSLSADPTVVHLWSGDGTPFAVLEVRVPSRSIEASVRRAGADELRPEGPPEQWRIELSLTDDAPLGPLTDELVVRTDHPRQPQVEIPVTGFVRAVLTSTPTVADFGRIAPNAPDKSRFVLKLFNFGPDPIEVRDARTDLDFVSVVTAPEERGRRFRVELHLAPDAPKGKFEGTLRLETTSAVTPVLEVPVRGRIG